MSLLVEIKSGGVKENERGEEEGITRKYSTISPNSMFSCD
jgi:hypothetical protein